MLDLTEISVIVPAYNVEKYIGECLDSLINQTFGDIEIICVNDGSTDSTLDILNEYASRDSRIRVISQKNMGVSAARNRAMECISGKYTYFMDSDDVLDVNALNELYEIIEDKQVDFVLFKIINFDNETGKKERNPYYDMKYLKEIVGEDIFSHNDLPEDIVFKIAVTPSSKLYRSALIENIRFPEGLIFEDNAFFIETFLNAERIYFHNSYLLNKRVRDESITHNPNESFMDFIAISEILIDLTRKYGLYEQYKEGLFVKIIRNTYLRFSQVPTDIKGEFFTKIKDYFTSKKDELDVDEDFQNGDERIRKIFYSAIESQNYREFELTVKCFDLNKTLEKRENKINFQTSKIRELSVENKKLAEENERLNNLNSQMMESASWKITKPMRKVKNKVKK